jgi:hypothetical protein
MHNLSLEYVLALGYAIFLLAVAVLLEMVARYAHQRSLRMSTVGFTYHPDGDTWRCPEDQHLFPVFSDPVKQSVTYRAPAAACNACRSKAACTDSSSGREIEHQSASRLQYGIQHFHRGLSLTLLVLANLILGVEILRSNGFYSRSLLVVLSILFCAIGMHLFSALPPAMRHS